MSLKQKRFKAALSDDFREDVVFLMRLAYVYLSAPNINVVFHV
jgi:hypothetical protein